MKLFPLYIAALSTLCGHMQEVSANDSLLENQQLIVHNRVLTQVNGKTFSVMDLVKRMDLFLQKNYPDLASSPAARYQFFSTQWRHYLDQLIDTELMLIDAERLELKVSDAEVREEVLSRFGPNVMPTLDKIGISYAEAKQLIHDELVVQRIQWFRVNSKVLSQVNSQDVKTAYKQYIEKHPETELWEYQVLSIRSSEADTVAARLPEIITLTQASRSLEELSQTLQERYPELPLTLSADTHTDNKSLSSAHRQVLSALLPGQISAPTPQVSRNDQSTVYRLFHLKQHTLKPVPTFDKIADTLRNDLLQELATKENTRYLMKLKQHLGYDDTHMLETLPSDFQPFALAYR
jgi:hypothetical protein